MERAIVAPQTSPEVARRRMPVISNRILRWVALIVGPLVIFAIFMLVVGVDPIQTYAAMYSSSLGDFYGISEVLLRASPFILTGLATAIPAQVRLINVGGEG